MNLLGAKLYDPAAAVSKATSSLLAMTVFDTTNLRLTVTVPAHGMLRIRLCCTITGATTVPTIFLGVMNGATVVGRCNPQDFPGTMNAATQNCPAVADFIVTGLTPGSITLDAAYGVEVVVAATNIKYGGPNDTTTNNAWGAFQFEIWDPQPMTLALDGAVNVKQWNGTNVAAPATAGIPDVNVKNINNISAAPITTIKAVQGLATDGVVPTVTNLTNLPSIPANWLTAAGIAASALNGKGDWNIGKTGYALSAAGIQAIWDAATSALTTVGSIGKWILDKLDVVVSTRAASGSAMTLTSGERTAIANEVEAQIIDETDSEKVLTAITDKIAAVNPDLGGLTLAAIASAVRTNLATEMARIDVAISTRGTGTALDAAAVRAAIGLALANLDTQLDALPTNAELATALAAADDATLTQIALIKAKTDSLTFTKAGEVDANIQSVNDTTVIGDGHPGTEWNPA